MTEITTTSPLAGWPDATRLWLYNANRELTPDEAASAKTYLADFAERWVSHNRALTAYSDLLYNRLVVLGVDESAAGASGCSIDGSVRALQALGRELGVDFFERMIFLVVQEDGVRPYGREAFAAAYAAGELNDQTPVVDTLVTSVAEARSGLVKPLSVSWHARMV